MNDDDEDYFILDNNPNIYTSNLLKENGNKTTIFVRSSLVASLIGKSQYNKYYETFIKLLKINKFSIYNDNYEFEDILNTDFDILSKTYSNIYEIQNQLYNLQKLKYKESIIEKYKKFIICSFGKQNELNVLNEYLSSINQKQINNDIKNKEFTSNKIFECDYFDIVLSGTPDYIDENGTIIEIKNRIHAFSKSIKENDYIQLQLYLNMFNCNKGKLVEGMVHSKTDIKLNIFEIEKDEKLFLYIKECIIRISILLYLLIKNENLYKIFNSKSNIDKNNFIVNNMNTINSFFINKTIDDNQYTFENIPFFIA